ncbi:MAG: ribbon-helix-helix domain-containing protein [Candidatus Diapherotrites archaeon]
MGKMLSFEVSDAFAEAIDAVVRTSGIYSSRSEFLKDSVRKNVEQAKKTSEFIKKLRASSLELAKKAKSRGWDGKMASYEQKDKWAKEWVKKNWS